MRNATSIRKTKPSALRLVPWATFARGGGTRKTTALPRDPHGCGRSPDRETEEEVDDVDGDERGTDGPAPRRAHPGRSAGRVIAVVAVDQHDDDREDDHF